MGVHDGKVMIPKASFYSIKILLPLECLKKKLREIGIIHGDLLRPIGKPVFGRLKDYEIISWYSVTAKKL